MSTQIDSSIPVLTEVIINPETIQTKIVKEIIEKQHEIKTQIPSQKNEFELPASLQVKEESQSILLSEESIEIPFQIKEEDWKKLEITLKENILRQVLARIDFVLEHKVRDSLAEILQVSVDKLANDIQFGLKNSLEDVVTRAVTQEIAKVRVIK